MINRRRLLLTGFGVFASWSLSAAAQYQRPKILLVHGRAQGGKVASELQEEWLEALRRGAHVAGSSLPNDLDISMPYYGDTLDNLVQQLDIPLTEEIHRRGGQFDDGFLRFQAEVAEAMRLRAGITDEQVDVEYGDNTKPKGPLNWEWVQAILRSLDKHGGGLSQGALEVFLRDVYVYITNATVRRQIDQIVEAELTDQPTIVIAHSLGSVIAYNILQKRVRNHQVPLFLTLGSPLAIRAIRDELRPLKHPVSVTNWYNGYDERDVVSLYPLDQKNFPLHKLVHNYTGIRNRTTNHHGIEGYLEDTTIIKKILNAATY